jgi:hypothetical protein
MRDDGLGDALRASGSAVQDRRFRLRFFLAALRDRVTRAAASARHSSHVRYPGGGVRWQQIVHSPAASARSRAARIFSALVIGATRAGFGNVSVTPCARSQKHDTMVTETPSKRTATMTHIEAAKQIARTAEYGCNYPSLCRGVSRLVGRAIMPRTKAAEEARIAYHAEREQMQREKQTLRSLERSFSETR